MARQMLVNKTRILPAGLQPERTDPDDGVRDSMDAQAEAWKLDVAKEVRAEHPGAWVVRNTVSVRFRRVPAQGGGFWIEWYAHYGLIVEVDEASGDSEGDAVRRGGRLD